MKQMDGLQSLMGKTIFPGGDTIQIELKGLSMGIGKTAPGTAAANFRAGTAGFSFNASMFDDPNETEMEKSKGFTVVKVGKITILNT